MGGSFDVFDHMKQPRFKVKGSFELLGLKLEILDLQKPGNQTVCHITSSASQALSFTPKVKIKQGGQLVATVKQEMSFMTPKFKITLADGQKMKLKGNWLKHNYTIIHPSKGDVVKIKLAMDWSDAYNVYIQPGQDIVLAIAYAIVVDKMAKG